MKRIGIVLAAVVALAFGVQPLVAQAAAAAKGPPITAKQREQGKAEAPAAVQAAKITCNIADAALLQTGNDAKTKAKVSIYEVACQDSIGYVIQQSPTEAQAFDCLAQAATAPCRLEGNLDPKAGLAKMATAAGHPCTATDARVMGATPSGDTFYEVACGPGKGYVIQAAAGKAPTAIDCISTMGGGAVQCTLTSKASILAGLGDLVTKSGKTCTISDGRMVGADTRTGSTFYEVACGATPGFMLKASNQGAFEEVYDCGKAQSIGGGCTLTTIDETAEASTYTKLAQAAAYPCDVSKYRFLGKEPKSNSEIVELACKNRPDGGIALFPISGGKAQVYDCVQGGFLGLACQLTPATAAYSKYTDRLVAQGKNQCKVKGAKFLAATTTGADYIETACSDGLPGFVISIDRATGKTNELLSCGQASRAGAACTLPTNKVAAAN